MRAPHIQAEVMKKVLVIRNVSYETEGLLESLLRDEGLELAIVDFQQDASVEPRLDGYAGVVVMGGPMGANDTDRFPYLLQVERLCLEAMERSIPLVGVCLGAQIMAKVLGSEVYPNPVREVGWYDLTMAEGAGRDPLFSGLDPREVVLQWHGDTFDLPKGAVLLASSPDCVNQAFRYGDNGYAVQFHLEILESMIREWVGRDAARGWLRKKGRISATRILADTDTYMSRSEELGRQVYSRFARMIAA